MTPLPRFRNFLFGCRHLFRGAPAAVEGEHFRLDESLRRWRLDGEPEVTALLENKLQAGDCFVDIGANFGLHTLYAARKVGASGLVVAFEPVPGNLHLLKRNLKLNGLTDRVTVVPKAVSNSSAAFLEMVLPDDSVAVAASLRCTTTAQGRKVQVPNTRLDDYPLSGAVPRLIKVDVEGAELEVFRGGEQLLQRAKPDLLVEVHGYALPAFGASVHELLGYLSGLGYHERRLTGPQSRGDDYYQALFVADKSKSAVAVH